MSKPKQTPVVMTGLDITSRGAYRAIDIADNTMTLNPQATIRMGGIELTEDKFARMEIALEFIERFAAENEQAHALWTAIKAKKRILK